MHHASCITSQGGKRPLGWRGPTEMNERSNRDMGDNIEVGPCVIRPVQRFKFQYPIFNGLLPSPPLVNVTGDNRFLGTRPLTPFESSNNFPPPPSFSSVPPACHTPMVNVLITTIAISSIDFAFPDRTRSYIYVHPVTRLPHIAWIHSNLD